MFVKHSQRSLTRSIALFSILAFCSNFSFAGLLSRDALREHNRSPRDRVTNDRRETKESSPSSSNSSAKKPAVENFAGQPLSFEANKGQADASVQFLTRGPGAGVLLSPRETTLLLTKPKPDRKNAHSRPTKFDPPSITPVSMKLQNSNPNPKLIGLDELTSKTNYFIGNDPAKWQTDISSYKRVKYEAVYPGIDVIYYGNQNQLEYDFVVAPYANPNSIKIRFDDRSKLRIARNGDLIIAIGGIEVRQLRPNVYQNSGDRKIAVSGRYVLRHQEISFEIGEYDRSKPLIIDPLLSYSSHLRGTSHDIALDSARNMYIVGVIWSTGLTLVDPVQSTYAGNADIYIQKFDPTGSTLLFSSYLGGNNRDDGNGYAEPSIAVDPAGNIYVRGTTSSTNFPTVNAVQSTFGGGLDSYVAKINASGNQLIYSTYLGGSSLEEWGGIAVDQLGNAYVAGGTYSTNFPTHNPLMPPLCNGNNRDVFVSVLNPTGSFIYSTHIGGTGDEAGKGIAVDGAGNAYVTGRGSSTFPTTPGAYQTSGSGGFITKINADGSALLYSTRLAGATDSDDIAIDSSGNAYITGYTSGGLPTVNAFQPSFAGATDVFYAKLDSTGSSLLFASYLGGSGSEYSGGIAVDSDGNVYLTGVTIGGFPLVNAVQSFMGGGGGYPDAFVTKVDSSGTSLAFSTYLGGTGQDEGDAIAVDSDSNAYVTGWTAATDFPKVNPYLTSGTGFLSKYTGLKTYKISGHITDVNGAGFAAVTVNMTGGQSRTTQTNANGDYIFTSVPSASNYTITAVKAGFSFSPTNHSFTNLSADQIADFTTLFYSLSGRVTNSSGAGLSGATLTITGTQTQTAQTDANGNYTFPNVAAHGNYTMTPSKVSYDLTYAFTPATRTITNLSANQTGLDFSSSTSTVSAMNPVADAYVQDGSFASTNFGSVTALQVKTDNQTGQRRDVYFKFDLSSLSRSIITVKLRIYAALSASGSIATSAHSVTDTTWGETAINWNNKPARSTSALTGATVTVNSTTYAAYDIDVTTYVKGEKTAGRDIVSLALHNGSNSTPYILLNSREAASNKPQLVVTTSNNNNAPTVSLTSPTSGAPPFTAPASIPLSANASDTDGTISKVEFYAGTSLIGTATSSPYNVTWNNVPSGSYSLTAIATDNSGTSATSSAVSVSVNNGNSLPTNVSLISPLSGTNFGPGANITLSATAIDQDGIITKVEFFAGATLVGTAITPSLGGVYTVTWNNAAVGSYALTAKATDNSLGTTTSSAVNVNVVGETGLLPAADAYVKDGSSASTNFGTAADLQTQLGASGSNRESYLRFDLTTVGSIVKAKLRLFGKISDATANNLRVGVYSVASTTWVETGSGSITWNNKPASGGAALSTVSVTDNTTRWYEFDVSAYVQSEKTLNHNLVSFNLKSIDSSNSFITFSSRDATAASDNRPQLIVWTTQPRNALLVVGSTSLNAGDNAVKTRLQNLGFTVTAKQAGTNNNAINTSDADGKALVLISSSVIDANVLAKFRYVAVPVINWESNVLDDMGLTGATASDLGTTTTTQTQVSIVSPSHALAAGLSGVVTVVTSASNFSWGAPNINAAKIATMNGDANKSVIFAYDKGVTMPGLNAPARRVALFMTDLTAGSFNTNGGALFDAAVKWITDVVTAPIIQTVTPGLGNIGTTVTITGSNFGTTQGASSVSFNGVPATPSTWNDMSIVAPVPLFATTGPVLVVVNGVNSNTVVFSVGDVDSDADGLADWWEIQYFGNLSQTANADPDGDSLTNIQEFQQGRNPTKNAQADDGTGVNLKIYTPLGPLN